MKRLINLFILSLLAGWVWFTPLPAVVANHEPDHNVDLILENANYVPYEGRFEVVVRNVGPDPILDPLVVDYSWYNENNERVLGVEDQLLLADTPLGFNETRTFTYDLFNILPNQFMQTMTLFDPYGMLADLPAEQQLPMLQPELRVTVDPFNLIPEMNETNNSNAFFIQLFPELELGALLEQGVEGANLRLEFFNIGLSPITVNEGIAVIFEWLNVDQIAIEGGSMINFYPVGVDFEGSGNPFFVIANSADDIFVQSFVTQPLPDAVFLRITANPLVFGEWFSRDNNVQVVPVPAEFFLNNDASLASLTLEPAFDFIFDPQPLLQLYEVNAPFTQESINITAIPNDANATVTINELAPDEMGFVTLGLAQGVNEIGVVVRAANGIGMRLYGILVTRAEPPPPAAGGSSWPSWRRYLEETPAPETTPLPPTTTPSPSSPTPPTTEEVPSSPLPSVTPVEEVLGVQISHLNELIATLQPGTRGREVREIQKELKKLGYYPLSLRTHGYYGAATVRAVLKYERGKK